MSLQSLQIIIKYLNMVKLNHETAKDGLECTNMVFAKEPGYYSLIIVSYTDTCQGPLPIADRSSVTSKCQSRMATKLAVIYAPGKPNSDARHTPLWLSPPTP